MSTIRSTGTSSYLSENSFDLQSADPLMQVELMMIEQSAHDRQQHKTERNNSLAEAHALQARAADEELGAANSRLIGGIFGAAATVTQGVASVAAGAASQSAARTRAAGISAQEVHDLDASIVQPKAAAVAQQHQLTISEQERSASTWNAVGQFANGAGQLGSAISERVGASNNNTSKSLERQAEQAKAHAQDLSEAAAGDQEYQQRVMGRMEEIRRAQRQAEDARIANMRG
jgi:hypothetical protein